MLVAMPASFLSRLSPGALAPPLRTLNAASLLQSTTPSPSPRSFCRASFSSPSFGRPPLSSRRFCRLCSTASSSEPCKNEYLVIVPDNPNSLQKRLAVREQHLENVRPHVRAGVVVLGGAILSRHPREGEQPDMTGSAMLVKAESEEAVREWIAGDVYAKGGGPWNVAEAKIYPFRSVVRTGM